MVWTLSMYDIISILLFFFDRDCIFHFRCVLLPTFWSVVLARNDLFYDCLLFLFVDYVPMLACDGG